MATKYKIDRVTRIPNSSGRFEVTFTPEKGETTGDQVRYRDIDSHISAHSGRADVHSQNALSLWLAIQAVFPRRSASLPQLITFAQAADCADLLVGVADVGQAWERLFAETNIHPETDTYVSAMTVDGDSEGDGDVLAVVKQQVSKSAKEK